MDAIRNTIGAASDACTIRTILAKAVAAKLVNLFQTHLDQSTRCSQSRSKADQCQAKTRPKVGSKSSKVILKWAQSRPKGGPMSTPKSSKVGPKSAQSWLNVKPKLAQSQSSWPQVGSKLVQSLPKVVPKWAQSRPKVGPMSTQCQPKVGPKLAHTRPKDGPKSTPKVGPMSTRSRPMAVGAVGGRR